MKYVTKPQQVEAIILFGFGIYDVVTDVIRMGVLI